MLIRIITTLSEKWLGYKDIQKTQLTEFNERLGSEYKGK